MMPSQIPRSYCLCVTGTTCSTHISFGCTSCEPLSDIEQEQEKISSLTGNLYTDSDGKLADLDLPGDLPVCYVRTQVILC